MQRVGEARVEVEDGEIRNGFETVRLGKKLEVVVPTLVHIDDNDTTQMFELSTERLAVRSRQLRIMARCICETCDQLHLVDRDDSKATEFFRPRAGQRLGSDKLPSVIPHSFGLIMMMMGGVPKLFEEVREDTSAGLVTAVSAN